MSVQNLFRQKILKREREREKEEDKEKESLDNEEDLIFVQV